MHAVRRIQFCSGHRVKNHESKCANPHGHNYIALFYARSDRRLLDEIGRVIDFSVLKEKIGAWIDENWDHRFLCYEKDSELFFALSSIPDTPKLPVKLPFNPTAENMANYLLKEVCPSLLSETGVEIFKIELWETENCKVEVTLE